ncbi:MAG: glycosyltransferase family 4 protein [Patescibacteria group bacterium]
MVPISRAPQGVDLLSQFGLKAGEYLLGVGRLVPNKAYDVAIEAFRDVQTEKKLVIVGEAFHSSHYDQKLRDLADKDHRVKLLGYQSGEPLRQILSHAHAFVHPSRAEGLSVAIIEAMANAKLVIMSDIKENLELVDHSGLAFPTDDVKALTLAMQMVVDDPEMARQRGLRAREVVRKEYSWESVILRLEAFYKRLLGA